MSYTYPEFQHYEMKHYLKDAPNMPLEALAVVTDEHLEEYRAEWDIFHKAQCSDVEQASELSKMVRKGISLLFGNDYSKQAKYFNRSLQGGEVVTDLHMNKYPKPHVVEDKIAEAKQNVDIDALVKGVEVGVTEETLNDVDSAVTYLIKQGYQYGTDFNTTNAYQMAKSVVAEQVITNPEDFTDRVKGDDICSWCKGDVDTEFALQTNRGGYRDTSFLKCSCGDSKYNFTIGFNGGESDVKVIKTDA